MMGTWRRICDDRQEDIRRIETAIRKSLNKTGQAVRLIISSFLNGGQLYDAACRENFDLLFLDIEMPCMDGFELAAKLCMDRPQSGDQKNRQRLAEEIWQPEIHGRGTGRLFFSAHS